MLALYVVSSDFRNICILTYELILDFDPITDIFISKDDIFDECHDGCAICGKF